MGRACPLAARDGSGHAHTPRQAVHSPRQVAVLDTWLSTGSGQYDKASVTLELEGVLNGDGKSETDDAFVGVVGRNFKTW